MVAPVTGAPSDGNRQLYSGMRRALGSSKIVIVDAAGADVFTVVGTVSLTPIDDQQGQLVVKWLLKDPAGRNVGDLEQSNPVPLAACQRLVGRIRRHRRDGGVRKACSNCSTRRSIGTQLRPQRATLNRLVRGVCGCYCLSTAARFLQEARAMGDGSLCSISGSRSRPSWRPRASRACWARRRPGADAQGRDAFGPQDPRSDLDHRLHRAQPRLHGLGHAVRDGRESSTSSRRWSTSSDVSADKLTWTFTLRDGLGVAATASRSPRRTASPRSSAGRARDSMGQKMMASVVGFRGRSTPRPSR